jgi:hypothetical protein
MILHYVFGMADDFGGKPWSWVHYMSVRTARTVNPDDAIRIWIDHEPEGEWWNATTALPAVEVYYCAAPKEIHGNPLCHPAHQADVIRLQMLAKYGGVYLDSDVWCLKPFASIDHCGFWMGRQGRTYGLCNATMGGYRDSAFPTRWLDTYRSFRSLGHDKHWDEHSVRHPLMLATLYPDEVTILPETALFHPLWNKTRKIFQRGNRPMLTDSISVHLWESKTWDWLSKLTPDAIDRKSEIGGRLAEIGCL